MTRLERKQGLELIDAVASGDLSAVRALLDAGVNPSLVIRHNNWGKTTALIVALEKKFPSIALLLVQAGADFRVQIEEQDSTVITRAVRCAWLRLPDESQYGDLETLIELLLGKGERPSPDCLVTAASCGDLKRLRSLLAIGLGSGPFRPSAARPEMTALDGALAAVVIIEQEKTSAELLKAGANPNTHTSAGPCVNVAVAHGNISMVRELIAAKADLNQLATVTIGSFREGRVQAGLNRGNLIIRTPAVARNATPLIIAIRSENEGMFRLLIDGGADINATDAEGLSPLAWAVRSKFEPAETLLRARGASEATLEGSPLRRLYHAAATGDAVKVREALAAGAEVNGLVEKRGTLYTPLIRAARAGRCEIIDILVQAGADPNLVGRESLGATITPLMIAAREGQTEAVKHLLRAGALTDISITTPLHRAKGWDALKFAKDGGQHEMIALIQAAAKSEKAQPAEEAKA